LSICNLSKESLETFLIRAGNNPDYLLEFSSHTGLENFNINGTHAHSIVGYNPDTKMVKIANPHNYSNVTEVPLEKLHSVLNRLNYVKVKSNKPQQKSLPDFINSKKNTKLIKSKKHVKKT
jgi:hypothetical protein